MVLEIRRRRIEPLVPPLDRWPVSHIYWWLQDWRKAQKLSKRKRVGSVRRKNQRRANYSGIARRPEAHRARRVGKKFRRNIARSLPLHGTPLETSRMLLKMEKDVNACLRGCRATLSRCSVGSHTQRKYRNATTCLRTEQAVVDSPRLQPHCCDSRDCKRYHSGAGRESYSGGRATWASLSSLSSG